jgi:hypothetical protein
VTIRTTTNWYPITDDAHGNEPADFIYGGKSCTVEGVFISMTGVHDGAPWIGDILHASPASVGLVITNGVDATSANLGKELIITERDHTAPAPKLWKAKLAVPSDPSEITLRSTQEHQLAIAWTIAPDASGALFYVLPDYLPTYT